MDACTRLEPKNTDRVNQFVLPESCNLVALSSDKGGPTPTPAPTLHRRNELPEAPAPSSTVTVAADRSSSSSAASYSSSADSTALCDPCTETADGASSAKPYRHANPSGKTSIWFNAGLLSYHPTDHTHQFNDTNYGGGIEIEKNATWALAVGEYRNSVRHNSYYGMIEYRPLHLGPIKAGIAGGTINGYPEMNKGKFFPAAMPVVSFEEKHFGTNFIYIPNVVKGVEPALSMQLKFKF